MPNVILNRNMYSPKPFRAEVVVEIVSNFFIFFVLDPDDAARDIPEWEYVE